jgi:hypothetical protein
MATPPPYLTLNSRVRVNDEVLFQELEGEAVLLNLNSGIYFGLDPIGTLIWQLLGKQKQLSEIVDAIVADYEVSEERCKADVLSLLEDLQQNKLVEIC